MGKMKFCLCLKKKQAKKSIFAPKIAPRVELSDPARNSYFPADFLGARLQWSQFLHNWEPLYGGGGERGIDRAQTMGPNCSMTHSPGKIEYNCRYFIMSFRKQIGEYKFGKKFFYTLRSIMSHHPSTNSSSLKITAAYCTLYSVQHRVYRVSGFLSCRPPLFGSGRGDTPVCGRGGGGSQFGRRDRYSGTLGVV